MYSYSLLCAVKYEHFANTYDSIHIHLPLHWNRLGNLFINNLTYRVENVQIVCHTSIWLSMEIFSDYKICTWYAYIRIVHIFDFNLANVSALYSHSYFAHTQINFKTFYSLSLTLPITINGREIDRYKHTQREGERVKFANMLAYILDCSHNANPLFRFGFRTF